MRIKGKYLAGCGTTYVYSIDVYSAEGIWAMEGTVKARGRTVAMAYDTLNNPWSTEAEVEVFVHNWVARYIEANSRRFDWTTAPSHTGTPANLPSATVQNRPALETATAG